MDEQGKCKGCVFWTPDDLKEKEFQDLGYGTCKHITYMSTWLDEKEIKSVPAFAVPADRRYALSGYFRTFLVTHAGFGCTEFKQKGEQE